MEDAPDIARVLRQAVDSHPCIHGVEPVENIARLAEKFEALVGSAEPEIVLSLGELRDTAMSVLAISTRGLDGYFPKLRALITEERLEELDRKIWAMRGRAASAPSGK